jgi:sialate O-acetylesterase
VQLAPYHYYYERDKPRVPNPDALPEMWEAQTAAQRIGNTGMAITMDLVDDLKDIHPTRKLEVGQRLARLALSKTYGRKMIACYGPMFRRLTIKGNQAIVSFSHAEGGLATIEGSPPAWFTIAGADNKFFPADAVIQDESVVLTSSQVPSPKHVRFAWNEGAQPNLLNLQGLPAGPFRTDQPEAGH